MEDLRGKVNAGYKAGQVLGTFIIIDLALLITALSLGLGWRIVTWLIPQIGGGC